MKNKTIPFYRIISNDSLEVDAEVVNLIVNAIAAKAKEKLTDGSITYSDLISVLKETPGGQ